MKWSVILTILIGGCLPQIDLDLQPTPKPAPTIEVDETDKPGDQQGQTQIVMFTLENCVWCEKQKAVLSANAKEYDVQYLDAADNAELVQRWDLPAFAPVTVIARDGKPRHVFLGYTKWSSIQEVIGK